MENKPSPIKRTKALQPISREHHHGLLLCWKIREGFRRGVAIERIKNYADWFWANHLSPHFEVEEKHLFVVLPGENELVRKALTEHRRLKRLFEENSELSRALSLIEEELERHIRFEERVLFNEIQKVATPEQLESIEKNHSVPVFGDWEDEFWK